MPVCVACGKIFEHELVLEKTGPPRLFPSQHKTQFQFHASILTAVEYKQVSVSVSLYSAFRAASHFKNPEAFVPERWLNESDEYINDKKEAFQPYSYGPRNCLGQQ
ncbi:MAG: cytochrome P450 [Kocuria palustris]|jgi:hypothetical protein|nr:cytochrome P450 [Kocuria palustris]